MMQHLPAWHSMVDLKYLTDSVIEIPAVESGGSGQVRHAARHQVTTIRQTKCFSTELDAGLVAL